MKILFLITFLMGCDTTITPQYIKIIEKECESHEGWYSLSVNTFRGWVTEAYCKDNTKVNYRKFEVLKDHE